MKSEIARFLRSLQIVPLDKGGSVKSQQQQWQQQPQ
jgi:hypothetical protein